MLRLMLLILITSWPSFENSVFSSFWFTEWWMLRRTIRNALSCFSWNVWKLALSILVFSYFTIRIGVGKIFMWLLLILSLYSFLFMTFSKEFVIVWISIISSKIIGGRAGSLVEFGFVVASTTSIGSSIESSNVNLFVVLTELAAVFISPSLSSLRFLLLLPRSVATIQRRAATELENYCGFD